MQKYIYIVLRPPEKNVLLLFNNKHQTHAFPADSRIYDRFSFSGLYCHLLVDPEYFNKFVQELYIYFQHHKRNKLFDE